jgi:replication-associated recombination protein RarA
VQRKVESRKSAAENERRAAPDCYEPETPAELIGAARDIATAILGEIKKAKRQARTFKFLAYGQPGSGKTSVAKMIAQEIAANRIDIEAVNGRNLDSETVREWKRNSAYGSLFGGWKVKLINEADLIPSAAQDLMLTYLDDLPPWNAIIATSNQNVTALTERFQTRFRLVKIAGPTCDELARWLIKRWKLPKQAANFIALGAGGNVRMALLDSSDYLTFGKSERRPEAPPIVKDILKSDAAKRAWQTMRSRGLPMRAPQADTGKGIT